MEASKTAGGLTIRKVKLGDLHQDPANARAHDARNLDAIRASLARFGQAEPLVVQAGSGRVIGGNGRLEAMRSLGWTDCDVVELELGETQATALGIALNRTAELATWDDETLALLLSSLKDEGELDGVGFDDAEIDALLAELDGLDAGREGDFAPITSCASTPSRLNGDVFMVEKCVASVRSQRVDAAIVGRSKLE